MEHKEALDKIKAWFDSGKGYAAVRIYQRHGKDCCDGTAPLPDPARFESDVLNMQLAVGGALQGDGLREVARRNIQIVFQTLTQMYDTVIIPKDEIEPVSRLNVREVLGDTHKLAIELYSYVKQLVPNEQQGKGGGASRY